MLLNFMFKEVEIGKHTFMNIQVNAGNSFYWNIHIFYDLEEKTIALYFLIWFDIFITHGDRQTSLCIEGNDFVLEFLLY